MSCSNLSYEIVLPVLNEEKRLIAGVKKLLDFFIQIQFENFIITIVDNGSEDQTPLIARTLAMEYARVKFISIKKKGVGLALKTAWNSSVADVVGYMDVDLATDIAHFKEVMRLFDNQMGDVVNASRNLPSAKVFNRKFLRTILSHSYNKLLKHFLNIQFTDGMCGFKFLRRSVYQQLNAIGLYNDGWFFCTELLFLSERQGFVIAEIPVTWTDDNDSRVQLIKTIFYYLREMCKLRFRKLRGCRHE